MHEAAMRAPEQSRVQLLEKFFERAAFRLSFEGLRDHADDAFVDGREADLRLVDQEQAALRLHDEPGRRMPPARTVVEQPQERVDLRFRSGAGRHGSFD